MAALSMTSVFIISVFAWLAANAFCAVRANTDTVANRIIFFILISNKNRFARVDTSIKSGLNAILMDL